MSRHLKRLLHEMSRPQPRIAKMSRYLDLIWLDFEKKRQKGGKA